MFVNLNIIYVNFQSAQVSTWFANARRRIKKEMAAGKNHFEEDDEDNHSDGLQDDPGKTIVAYANLSRS